ncbi:MAG TPA: phosphatidate cytidylyltransferase [Steroidobacteraceae bacterium]|nr:phosphatidate cytidylyltransferase [Steroidobacteraceae bacterium]
MSESLRKRVATAAVLIALLLVVLFWLPAVATVAVLTLVVLMGAWEWSAFLKWTDLRARGGFVVLVSILLPLAWLASRTQAGLEALLGAAVLWWLIALAWIIAAPRRVRPWSAGLAGLLSLVPAWLALTRLRLDAELGAQWVLFALLLVWMADIGAYFCGRRFGRRRLAPAVSPGKTWEGAFGGLAASGVVAVIGGAWFRLPLGPFLALCLAAVAFSIVGDLTESLLKRFAGMKDSGTLFPGHGGVMDRIDSVTGAAPVLLLGLTFLGVLP